MNEVLDRYIPVGTWEFDKNVTSCFDNMLARSIPQYEAMRSAVFGIGSGLVISGTRVVDIGCSRGGSLLEFASKFPTLDFLGVDVSDAMVDAAKGSFEGSPNVDIQKLDLVTQNLPVEDESCSLIMSVLCLMFIARQERKRILSHLYDKIIPGGGLILVEKLYGCDKAVDDILVQNYYNFKHGNGYTYQDILRKKLSLVGAMEPVTEAKNLEWLYEAGFSRLECFWRWMNFGAWVAVK